MSYNQNFYNPFQGNYYTFHDRNAPGIQNTSLPPQFSSLPYNLPSDQEIIKNLTSKMHSLDKMHLPKKYLSINSISNQLSAISMALNKIKHQEKVLSDNIDKLTDTEWETEFLQIKTQKDSISKTFSVFSENNLKLMRSLLAKRSAKRLRLKRVQMEKRKEQDNKIKKLQEQSRKIDENLQKIKDDINKAKQDEETKLMTDLVLKEVLRKKHDAKKCIVKLDALIKLRKARQNTATGKGKPVNEKDANDFSNNIEKLKNLWMLKLSQYDMEEAKLRLTLKDQCITHDTGRNNAAIVNNLAKWLDFLFGENKPPQVDFYGDIQRFISTRSQWDQYVDSNGTSLPVGWVLPKTLPSDSLH